MSPSNLYLDLLFIQERPKGILQRQINPNLSTCQLNTSILYFCPSTIKSSLRKPRVEEIAYRPIPEEMDLDRIFSIKEERPVQGDNTINYKARRHQILPTKTRFGFTKVKVEI